MATFHISLWIPRLPADVFSFVSDFRNAPRWDPRTYSAIMVTDEPIGIGTRFELQGGLLTKSVHDELPEILRGNETLPYEIVEFDPPRLVAFRGESKTTRYHDRIQMSEEHGGTRLIYDAELTLRGLLEIGEPAFQVLFERIGRDATEPIGAAVIEAFPTGPSPG
jgi:Polyketide cyclase / dehydrase and lipid transport